MTIQFFFCKLFINIIIDNDGNSICSQIVFHATSATICGLCKIVGITTIEFHFCLIFVYWKCSYLLFFFRFSLSFNEFVHFFFCKFSPNSSRNLATSAKKLTQTTQMNRKCWFTSIYRMRQKIETKVYENQLINFNIYFRLSRLRVLMYILEYLTITKLMSTIYRVVM